MEHGQDRSGGFSTDFFTLQVNPFKTRLTSIISVLLFQPDNLNPLQKNDSITTGKTIGSSTGTFFWKGKSIAG